MTTERNPESEKQSKSEFRKATARSGVMAGSVISLGRSIGNGDEVTVVVSVLTGLAAAVPELRNAGRAAVNEVRRKVGRDKT